MDRPRATSSQPKRKRAQPAPTHPTGQQVSGVIQSDAPRCTLPDSRPGLAAALRPRLHICKCQRAAGASRGASGVSGPSGMIPRWPPPPLSPRARAGVALGSAKGGRGLRAQSRRRTQQRLVVEEGGARLAVALIIRSKRAFSRCQFTPATEGFIGSVVGQRVSGEAHAER